MSISVDWVSLTFADGENGQYIPYPYTSHSRRIGADGRNGFRGERIERENGSFMLAYNPRQVERPFLVDVTSGLASDMLESLVALASGVGHRCTRLDLRIDIECGEKLDAFKLRGELENAVWPSPRKPLLTAMSSDTDTLYIYSPNSPVRWRIYQKTPATWRYELQLRNDEHMHAALAWRFVMDGQAGKVWGNFASLLPLGFIPSAATALGRYDSEKREESGTLKWLYDACLPALAKLPRHVAREFIADAARFIDSH